MQRDLDRRRTSLLDRIRDPLCPLFQSLTLEFARTTFFHLPQFVDDDFGVSMSETGIDRSTFAAGQRRVLASFLAKEGRIGAVFFDDVIDRVVSDVLRIGEFDEPAADVV